MRLTITTIAMITAITIVLFRSALAAADDQIDPVVVAASRLNIEVENQPPELAPSALIHSVLSEAIGQVRTSTRGIAVETSNSAHLTSLQVYIRLPPSDTGVGSLSRIALGIVRDAVNLPQAPYP